jgi:CheY-like chemotaxis protein
VHQFVKNIPGLALISALDLLDRGTAMRSTQQVYVVDDEPLIARTLAAVLTDYGYDVTFFTDPLEVLKAVVSESPAFLVSDVAMPGLYRHPVGHGGSEAMP